MGQEQISEDALRCLELQMLGADIAQEKSALHARLMHQFPVLKEGGAIRVGKIKIQGRMVKASDCSRWERDNAPHAPTGHIIKLSVSHQEE